MAKNPVFWHKPGHFSNFFHEVATDASLSHRGDSHGPMSGWVAEPDDKPEGAGMPIHEIFGVNANMRKIAHRYVGKGNLTVVLTLFDKVQHEVELNDYPTDDYRCGNELSPQLEVNTAAEFIAAAVDAIVHAGNFAIIGYARGKLGCVLCFPKSAVLGC
ncbi:MULTISPECIES: dienelactone hydrolase family protein [unclassified Paraburkholderia]|uniref:dienelactone hydrolase family protein n=1 Tax=unclassified Paraburkholderia TaxID=2615204 RepID=UPI002AB0D5B4|nr:MULTISPECIES: dienelactone hydrolase family protein [unclassified Paraburkholderia]